VTISSVDQEATRGLVRAREDCCGDLMRSRHRLSKLLLRHGLVYYGGQAWTGAHDRWLRTEAAPLSTSLPREWHSMPITTTCSRCRPAACDSIPRSRKWPRQANSLRSCAGCVVCAGVHLDRFRFDGGDRGLDPVHRQHYRSVRRFGAVGVFVGFVAGTGSITKTGNTHARRLRVETAWHHRARYHVGAVMRSRWDRAPAAACARGDEGNHRLHGRWVDFLERRKRPVVANAAITRELAGWCWSLAVMDC
jgi:transposase